MQCPCMSPISVGVLPWELWSPMGAASKKASGCGAEGCVNLSSPQLPPGSPQGWRSSQQGVGQHCNRRGCCQHLPPPRFCSRARSCCLQGCRAAAAPHRESCHRHPTHIPARGREACCRRAGRVWTRTSRSREGSLSVWVPGPAQVSNPSSGLAPA